MRRRRALRVSGAGGAGRVACWSPMRVQSVHCPSAAPGALHGMRVLTCRVVLTPSPFAPRPADDMLSDDMLSGEEEEGEGQRRRGGRPDEDGLSEEEEEDEEGEDGEGEEWEDEAAGWGRGRRDPLADSEEEEEDGEEELAPSAHERRQQRMAEKIKWVGLRGRVGDACGLGAGRVAR